MTPQRIRNLQRARELDDDHPDLVCPGCGGDIYGWWNWPAHALGMPGTPVRFWNKIPGAYGPACPWTSDYLSARQHRRRLLREARRPQEVGEAVALR